MNEYLTRQSTDMQEKNQFEEMMKRKLDRKRNPHMRQADELLQQQKEADEA